MDYAVSRARLKNYFSTVTYIDDRFDHCIIDEPLDFGDEETVDTPPLPILGLATPPIATGEIAPIPHADEKDMEINLSTILAALNDEKYAGIRFTPVLFKDNLAKEILVKKIQESPLTLIDWNLGEKEKAFDFINLLFETTKQLKVIVCITYTNAAVDVIAERLSKDSFILPSTIHSFAWNAIKQYQSFLIDIVTNDPDFLPDEGDFLKVTEVTYTLGHRYKENGIQYLYHDDVLKLFCRLLDNAKFRRVFTDKYPLILIDEYQDSYKPIIDRFISFFIAEKKGPQFGFFGDAWQTIYQSNKACGLIENENLEIIKKGSNFRSAPRIVRLLNDLRPDLPQTSAIDGFDGEVIVITCDDYTGPRRTERNLKGELPAEELKNRLNNVTEKIKRESSKEDDLKVLMITHKVLATQQGYEQLLEILDDGLRDKEDPFLLFFMDTVEPIYQALKDSNMQLLFDTLGIKRFVFLCVCSNRCSVQSFSD